MTDARYPIGKFTYAGPLSAEQKNQCLDEIEQAPARLRAAVAASRTRNLIRPTATEAGPSGR